MSELVHNFDWYQATVPAHHEIVLGQLMESVPEPVREAAKGMWSYASSATVSTGGEVAARVFWGGVNPGSHVSSTGSHGQALAMLLRAAHPDHRVSRCDVAADMRGEGLAAEIGDRMAFIGRKFGLKGERIVPDDPDDGETYYLGSRSSPVRVRKYEKGKQLYKETGDEYYRQFFDVCRVEVQVKPQKEFKSIAATLEPKQIWGVSPWTRYLATDVFGLGAAPVVMKHKAPSNHERSMRALVSQYGRTLLNHMKLLKSHEAFLDDLLVRLDAAEQEEEPIHGV